MCSSTRSIERWSAGELSAAELSVYAGEYRHAVVALAEASAQAAESCGRRRSGRGCAAMPRRRPRTWRCGSSSNEPRGLTAPHERMPADADGPVLAQTRACVQAWTAGEDLLERLAVLYAIEAGQPEISTTKLEGLTAHYGFSEEGPATEYFRVHELRDVEHAREARELIAQLMSDVEDPEEQAERMVRRASAALRGNWLLLDGVEASSASSAAAHRRQANSTAATEVARLRLETPVRMGIAMRASALDEQLGAEAVALGAEREHGARWQPGGLERLAVGVQREQRAVALDWSSCRCCRRATGMA